MQINDCCVLIPSLSPDERLTHYAKELLDAGFGALVVVDDGSAAEYQPLFRELEGMDRCVVLHHEVNKGKGTALKTGMAYIGEHTAFKAVVTADSDGQHRVEDTLRICASLNGTDRLMILGSRDFSKESVDVPPRSKFGNRVTSAVFRLLYGRYLPDTQTGLRAFSRDLIPEFLTISGDRFEYEMNQLIYCARNDITMQAVPIRTVYIEENASSHFHPIRDSWRIYKLILGSFFRFTMSSLICWVVDIGLFTLLDRLILPAVMDRDLTVPIVNMGAIIFIATYGARIVSSVLNFKLNKDMVFSIRECRGAGLRYVVLVIAAALVSSLLVGAFNLLFPSVPATWFKIPVDLTIFVANYRIQKDWVFKPSKV